eukprot:jgi/Ulvmu1/10110/UM006_0060.1
MISSAEEILVPARFLTLTGHWIACVALAIDRKQISDANGGSAVLLGALAFVAVVLGAVEILSLMVGYTMFMRTWSSFQILIHFAGLVLVPSFMESGWQTAALTAIVITCSAVPFLIEGVLAFCAGRLSFQRW